MNFTKPIPEIIRERTSSRTYSGIPLDEKVKKNVIEALESLELKSPFNKQEGNIRFELINVPEFDPNEKKKLGTYGIIKGAQNFIVGAVKKFDFNREHFGYLMEKIILYATDMGLGTCWLGGTFNRSLFSTKIHKKEDEIVPAITPIGFSVKRTIKEKTIRKFIKADNRLLWDKLFFKHDFKTPLLPEETGDYRELLEMIRIGPSAGNKQPWRIIRDTERNNFNFYIVKGKGPYNQFPPLDIGIAVCHFDLVAKHLGINGNWVFKEPQISRTENYNYVISWFM
ncbi:MAG: nitroreductase family protein [Promethearchaeota archaeon]